MLKRNSSLDGLRAFAITLVIASHVGILVQGGVGNAIFFALGGFFAVKPFQPDGEQQFSSFRGCLSYYGNRLIRILPLYYVVLFGIRWSTGFSFFESNIDFVQNLLFIKSYGHLWFLQNTMFMYLCTPPILFLLYTIKKALRPRVKSDVFLQFLCATFLFLVGILANHFLPSDIFYLNIDKDHQSFHIGQYLLGMGFAYLYRAYLLCPQKDIAKTWKAVMDCCSLSVFLLAILSSHTFLRFINPSLENYYVGWERPLLCSALCGVVILLLLINKDGLTTRFLSLGLFGFLGKISFGIYLIHFFLLPFFAFTVKYKRFAVVYFLSFCAAYILYVLVEKPSVLLIREKKLHSVLVYYKDLFKRNGLPT